MAEGSGHGADEMCAHMMNVTHNRRAGYEPNLVAQYPRRAFLMLGPGERLWLVQVERPLQLEKVEPQVRFLDEILRREVAMRLLVRLLATFGILLDAPDEGFDLTPRTRFAEVPCCTQHLP